MPLFDLVLAAAIFGTAGLSLWVRDRTAAIAGFLVTGLLISLCWIRLGAPDVALAEAAIGAGLTGALLLRSARRIPVAVPSTQSRLTRAFAAALAASVSVAIVWVVSTTGSIPVYPPLVAGELAESGVSNPVTAVLLNFRAWDTLLEIAVLFVALSVIALVAPALPRTGSLGPLALPFARVVLPLSILLAGHLLWQGGHAPGGAFQAGAVLAGGFIAVGLSGVADTSGGLRRALAPLAVAGLAVFVVAALAAGILTGDMLGYPEGAAKAWIIAIESALTLSIAATLFLLFFGPAEGRDT